MPTFEYTGPVPSQPIDYDLPGGGGRVTGRVFGANHAVHNISPELQGVLGDPVGGEHVAAATNPDPSLFTEVSPLP